MPGVGGSGVVVAAALSQLGKPYIWDTPLNAADPNPRSFDCSGLSMWCYHKAGVKLGHQTNVQYRQLKHRPLSEAQPGDLVFFGTLADLYHVGVFIGNSTIVEAPDYGIPVRKRVINGNSVGIWNKVGVFPGAQTTSGGAKPVTYREFFTATLRDMGLPVTDPNLRALARVTIIEGTNDRWNPLNSVVPSGGSQSFNSNGVQDYGSYSNGVAGTVKLLSGSAWRNVVDALRSGNSEGGVITAFANTYGSWGSHPAFGAVSDSRANSLLNTSMGNSVAGSGSVTPKIFPKYAKDPLVLKAKAGKLTVDEVIKWADSVSFLSSTVNQPFAVSAAQKFLSIWAAAQQGTPKVAAAMALDNNGNFSIMDSHGTEHVYPSDPSVIHDPSITERIGDLIDHVTPSWVHSLGAILSWLGEASNWKRIGLFALGAIVLIISSVEFLKG